MRRRAGIESYASWIALAVAFSPVLLELGQNVARHAEDRVTLLAPLLLLLALRFEPAVRPPGRRGGALAIALGISLELIGLATGSASVARIGLPVAALGLARFSGRPAVATAALLVFAVPLPDTLVLLASPALQSATVEAVGALLVRAGAPLQADGLAWIGPGKRIVLAPAEGAASLALALATLGWYAGLRAGTGAAGAARRAALLVPLAIPLQIFVMLVAGTLLAADLGDAARFFLRQGGWLALAGIGLLWIECAAARPRPRRSGQPVAARLGRLGDA
jgi:hypothetical protein